MITAKWTYGTRDVAALEMQQKGKSRMEIEIWSLASTITYRATKIHLKKS